MTLAEFKAWLGGFEHSFDMEEGCAPPRYVPNGPQWEMIKAKLALVVSSPLATNSWKLPKPDSPDWYKTYVTCQNGQSTALDPKLAM